MPTFNTTAVAQLSGAVDIIARHRADLITSAAEINDHLAGWTVRATSAGSRSNPRAEVEMLYRDQRIMRMDVTPHGVQFIPVIEGLGQENMNKIARGLAKAIESYLEAKEALNPNRLTTDIEAAIDKLDAEPEKTWSMAMAGRPEAVINDAFSHGPGYIENIKPFMDDGDILVVKRGSRSMPKPVVESWWVMRGGRLDQIDEAEVRQLADANSCLSPD